MTSDCGDNTAPMTKERFRDFLSVLKPITEQKIKIIDLKWSVMEIVLNFLNNYRHYTILLFH